MSGSMNHINGSYHNFNPDTVVPPPELPLPRLSLENMISELIQPNQ